METMVDRLIEIADDLVRQSPRSSAAKRRAVSTAYYAAFHALAEICAKELIPGLQVDDPRFERIYRALEHGVLKRAFQTKGSPLKERVALRSIGDLIVPLRSERLRADYLPPIRDVFSRQRSEEIISQARKAVEELALLSSDDRRSLAAHLLFKDTPQ